VTKTEENVLPFDPFAPVSGQQRPNNPNPFSPSPVANPFLGVGVSAQPLQPNLIATAPLTGNFDFGYNQQPAANMGFNVGLNLNQPSPNFNPNPLGVNVNNNPFNPSMGINQVQVNPNVGYNPSGNINQPSNPYAQGFSVSGANPFTSGSSGFNNQPMTVVSNPFSAGQAQSTNPFLNSNPSAPFSNQNPLF